jgi:hypothetical protein
VNEITTRSEQTPAGAEPSLTLSQLQGLLRAAAELERAQRPIVLHAPATAPLAGDGGSIHVRIPAPPVAADTPAPVPRERNPWPIAFMTSGCTGLAAAGTAAATGSGYAVLAFLAAVAVWGTAAYQLVFNREG